MAKNENKLQVFKIRKKALFTIDITLLFKDYKSWSGRITKTEVLDFSLSDIY